MTVKPSQAILLTVFLLSMWVSAAFASANTPGKQYVSSSTLNVRLDASTESKITNTLRMGQAVQVYEVTEGWARVSAYYDGNSENIEGDVARWVAAQYLTSGDKDRTTLSTPVESSTPLEEAVEMSQDISKHRDVFISISRELTDSKVCTISDFQTNGGWMRSSNHKPKPVYFMFCGEMSSPDRVYLDASDGRVFR